MAEVTGYTKTQVDTLLGDKADALGPDDNYVTDGEKTALANLGTAAAAAVEDFAPAGSGAYPVQQVALTADLAYSLPVDAPADHVHQVVFTQPEQEPTGYTVTYGGNAVAVDLTAGASTTVELHPVGAGYVVRYPASGPTSGTNTGDQDLSGLAVKSANLSDLTNAATARTNLGLGNSATRSVGSGAGDVKAGDYAPDLSGYVPTSRTVNGKALSGNINIGGPDLTAPGEGTVNTVASSGAAQALSAAYTLHDVTMSENCTFTFTSPSAGAVFALRLAGAFTPTWPASVKWPDGAAPSYTSPAVYVFMTVNAGTVWNGVQAGRAFA